MPKIFRKILFICCWILYVINLLSAEQLTEADLKNKLNNLIKESIAKKKEKSKNLAEIIELTNNINAQKKMYKTLGTELTKLEQQINLQTSELKKNAENIKIVEDNIALLQDTIAIIRNDLQASKDKFETFICALQREQNKFRYSEISKLLESPTALNNRINYKRLSAYRAAADRKLISEYLKKLEHLRKLNADLENNYLTKKKLYDTNAELLQKLKLSAEDKKKQLNALQSSTEHLQKEISQRKQQMLLLDIAINNLAIEQKQTQAQLELANKKFREKKGKLQWPIKRSAKNTILANFAGQNKIYKFPIKNDGIEIRCADGQEVYAVESGVVLFSDWIDAYGWTIIISHHGGFITLYAHLKERLVKQDDKVSAGTLIGRAGDTGSLFGVSLFFQIRENKKAVDPEIWLKK